MTQYDNTNSGALFKNKDKTTDKHPDYTGKIDVDGRELRLAAWIKEGRSGKFMSLKVSEFQQKGDSLQAGTDARRTRYGVSEDRPLPMDDEIPF